MSARKLRPVSDVELHALETAVDRLKQARGLCRYARADNAAAYVRRALKSVQGAVRHAKRCPKPGERAP